MVDVDGQGEVEEPDDYYEQDGPSLFEGDAAPVLNAPPATRTKPRPTSSVPAQPESASVEQVPVQEPPQEETVPEPFEPADSSSPGPNQAPNTELPTDSGGDDAAQNPLALYRRYRPETFEQVIGQEHVTIPLQRAIANNRVNHAYLFSGPRGCGKTTCARILARCLNCEKGPTPTPCGHCRSCRELATGGSGSIDVIEIDAASHGRVDDARELREGVYFAPAYSRFKVYIIDEAHMVTKEGFNALLKVVEEPPPHVKFIFATTEPDKVIGTIRSRTHHYPFRLVPPKVLGSYLDDICHRENVQVDPGVLPLVVRAGAGSVRDSLSVLDQLLGAAGSSGVSYAQATALLGFTPEALLDEMVDAVAAGDAKGVFSTIDKVIETGQEPRRFAEDLLQRLRDLVIVAQVPDAVSSGLIDIPVDQAERFERQAAGLGAGELTRAAEVIAKGLTQMRGTTAPRLHLELMCARVLLPGADAGERGVHARLDRVERRVGMTGPGTSPLPDPGVLPARGAPSALDGGGSAGANSGAESAGAAPGAAPFAGPESSGTPTSFTASLQEPADSAAQDVSPMSRTQRSAAPGQPARPVEDLGARGDETAAGNKPRDPMPAAQSAPSDAPQQQRPAHPAEQTPAPNSQTGADQMSGSGPIPTAGAPGHLGTADVRRLWPDVLTAVKSHRRFAWILLSQNSQVLDADATGLTLAFNSAGARDSFRSSRCDALLRECLVEVIGADLQVNAIVEGSAVVEQGQRETPHQRPAARAGGVAAPGQPLASAQSHRPQPRGHNSEPSHHSGPSRRGHGSEPDEGEPQRGAGQAEQGRISVNPRLAQPPSVQEFGAGQPEPGAGPVGRGSAPAYQHSGQSPRQEPDRDFAQQPGTGREQSRHQEPGQRGGAHQSGQRRPGPAQEPPPEQYSGQDAATSFGPAAEGTAAGDPGDMPSMDDPSVDESDMSATQLVIDELDAEVIAEEELG